MNSRLIFLSVLTLCAAFPLSAQFEIGVGASPGDYYRTRESTGPSKIQPDPFAEALIQEFLTSKPSDYFSQIGISTDKPAMDLTMYLRRGFGRSELITMIFISEKSSQTVKDLAKRRLQGARLRELSAGHNLSYEKIRAKAQALKTLLVEKIRPKLENKYDGSKPESPTGTTDSPNP